LRTERLILDNQLNLHERFKHSWDDAKVLVAKMSIDVDNLEISESNTSQITSSIETNKPVKFKKIIKDGDTVSSIITSTAPTLIVKPKQPEIRRVVRKVIHS